MVIAPRFDKASRFSDGLATVSVGKKLGYIDKTGKIVLEPQFDGAVLHLVGRGFSEGLVAVELGGSTKFAGPLGKFGFMDKSGSIVIKPRFNSASNFSDGLANVSVGGKYGFIDKAGKFIIAPRFSDAYSFREGLARVRIGRKYGFIAR
jgi:hypothetical protein